VVSVRDWIETTLLELFVDLLIWHFKSDEEVWLLVKLLKQADLFVALRGSLEDPTVGAAVWGTQSLFKEVHGNIVRDGFSFGDDLS
jgi:hypothetical protein